MFSIHVATLNPLLEGTLILGGNSNVAFDQGLDKSNPSKTLLTHPTRASLKVAGLVHSQCLVDVWREVNPLKRDYTHFSSPHHSYARIDHILIATHQLPNVSSSKIIDTTLSDHSVVTVSLFKKSHHSKCTQWRLNESILSDPIRVTEINKALLEYFTLNGVSDTSAEMLWAAHKVTTKGKVIQIATQINKEKKRI